MSINRNEWAWEKMKSKSCRRNYEDISRKYCWDHVELYKRSQVRRPFSVPIFSSMKLEILEVCDLIAHKLLATRSSHWIRRGGRRGANGTGTRITLDWG